MRLKVNIYWKSARIEEVSADIILLLANLDFLK